MISLSLTIRFISAMRRELTHTAVFELLKSYMLTSKRTLFADQGIVSVIGIVRVSRRGTTAITEGAKVELCLE